MNICYCFNDGYFIYGYTSIHSIIKHNNLSIVNIYILTDGLSNDNIHLLENLSSKFVYIKIIKIDDYKLKDLKILPHLGIWTYYRLLIDNYIKNVERIIYIDADTIVLGNISELRNIELGNNIVGAVKDIIINENTQGSLFMKNILGLNDYFNAGVLLIDLNKWVEEKISEKTIDRISKNSDVIKYADQDGLNVILEGKRKSLSNNYNCMDLLIFKSKDDILIRHYIGLKPRKISYIFQMNNDGLNWNGKDFVNYFMYYRGAKTIFFIHLILYFIIYFLNYLGIYAKLIYFKRKMIKLVS